MSGPSHTRRFICALLAIAATATVQGLWLDGMDRDAAATVARATA